VRHRSIGAKGEGGGAHRGGVVRGGGGSKSVVESKPPANQSGQEDTRVVWEALGCFRVEGGRGVQALARSGENARRRAQLWLK
jgi:hypothetical protein